MGKEKKELHPADKERRKHKKRDLKKNAGLRKTHRETILGSKTPDEILSEIHKINRTIMQGLADDKAEIRKKQLVDAHRAAMKKLNETKQAKPKEEPPQVVIKGMNKIFRTKAVEGKKDDEQLALENKTEFEEEDAKVEGEEIVREVSERKDRAYARYSEEDLSAMTFDDSMVVPVDEDESSLLEAPPGIIRPPGVLARRQRNRQIRTTLTAPSYPVPSHIPPQRHRPDRPERRAPVDPLDFEAGLRGSAKAEGEPAAVPADMPEEEEEQKEERVVVQPINKAAIISAAPQRPALPPVNAASIAFIPTSLLIKNRNAEPAAAAKRPPAPVAAKKPEKKGTKRSKAASSSSAYDEFMKEIDALEEA